MGTVKTVKSSENKIRAFSDIKSKEYFISDSELYIKLLESMDSSCYKFNAICFNDDATAFFKPEDSVIPVSKVDISYTI